MNTKFLRGSAASLLLVSVAYGADTSPSPDSPPSDSATEEIGEVIVTALRREQSIESTPAAISVVKGSDLTNLGVTNPQDLTHAMPNIQNGVAGFAIRGIASGDDTEKGDPSTAFSVDGIYIGRPQLQTLSLFDLDRIEVLRGPQGTLYGRNSTAGAVNVITARPVDNFDMSATLETGNYGTRRASGMVNIPFSDNLILRFSGAYNKHDGYTPTQDGSDALDAQEEIGARAKLLARIGDRTTITFGGDYANKDDSGAARLPLDRVLADGTTAGDGDSDNFFQNPGADGYYKLNTRGLTLDVSVDLGFAQFTSLTGYRNQSETDIQLFMDLGGNQGVNHISGDQFSQELRLVSNGDGKFQWVAGLFYFEETTDTDPVVTIPNFAVLRWDLNANADSKAAFVQGSYSLAPTFRLIGGLRYTEDSRDRDGTFQFGAFPPADYDAAIDGDKVNWKAGLEWDVADGKLLYLTAATGYKSAGFNDGNPTTEAALYYDPETLLDIEAGFKGRFFDDRLYLGLSVFNYDYKGLQLTSVPPTGGKLTLNAAKATVRGFEAEGNLKVLDNGFLDFSLSLLDAKYDEYLPDPNDPDTSFADLYLDRSPKTSFRVGYTQDFPVGSGNIRANVATKYTADYYVSDFSIPQQYKQPAFWRSDVSVGWFAEDDQWSLQAFVRNLEDERQLGLLQFGTFQLTDPRQYGVRLRVNY